MDGCEYRMEITYSSLAFIILMLFLANLLNPNSHCTLGDLCYREAMSLWEIEQSPRTAPLRRT